MPTRQPRIALLPTWSKNGISEAIWYMKDDIKYFHFNGSYGLSLLVLSAMGWNRDKFLFWFSLNSSDFLFPSGGGQRGQLVKRNTHQMKEKQLIGVSILLLFSGEGEGIVPVRLSWMLYLRLVYLLLSSIERTTSPSMSHFPVAWLVP